MTHILAAALSIKPMMSHMRLVDTGIDEDDEINVLRNQIGLQRFSVESLKLRKRRRNAGPIHSLSLFLSTRGKNPRVVEITIALSCVSPHSCVLLLFPLKSEFSTVHCPIHSNFFFLSVSDRMTPSRIFKTTRNECRVWTKNANKNKNNSNERPNKLNWMKEDQLIFAI